MLGTKGIVIISALFGLLSASGGGVTPGVTPYDYTEGTASTESAANTALLATEKPLPYTHVISDWGFCES